MIDSEQTENIHTLSDANVAGSKPENSAAKYPYSLERQSVGNAPPQLTLVIPSNDSSSLSPKITNYDQHAANSMIISSTNVSNKVSTPSRPLANSNKTVIVTTAKVKRVDSSKFSKNFLDVAELPSPVCAEMNFINKPVWGGKNYLNTMVSPAINDSVTSLDTLLSQATQQNLIMNQNHQNSTSALFPSTAKMNIHKENHYEIDKIGESSSNKDSSANRCSSTMVASSSASIFQDDSEKDVNYSYNENQYPDTVKVPSTSTFDALRINAPSFNDNQSSNHIGGVEISNSQNEKTLSISSEMEKQDSKPFKFDSSSINDKLNNVETLSVPKYSGIPKFQDKSLHSNIQPLTHSRVFSTPLSKDSPILTRVLDLNKHIINNSLISSNNNISNSDLYGVDTTSMIRREQKSIPVSPVNAKSDQSLDGRISSANSVTEKKFDTHEDQKHDISTNISASNSNSIDAVPSKTIISKANNLSDNNKKVIPHNETKSSSSSIGDVSIKNNEISINSKNETSVREQQESHSHVDEHVLSKNDVPSESHHAKLKISDLKSYNPPQNFTISINPKSSGSSKVDDSSSSKELRTSALIESSSLDLGDEFDESNYGDKDIYIANDFTNVKRKWVKVRELGRGSFSTVILAKLLNSNTGEDLEQSNKGKGVEDLLKFVAIKITRISSPTTIDKSNIPAQSISKTIIDNRMHKQQTSEQLRLESSLQREFEIISSLNHPCIIKMLATNNDFTTTNVTILNYCQGGDLFDFASKFRSQITPFIVQRIFCEIVLAIHHLHIHNIVHRDIKLENILLNFTAVQIFAMDDNRSLVYSEAQSKNVECTQAPLVTLADFGLSKRIDPENPFLETRCGSTDYVAPELLMGTKYDGRQTDSWALGVLLYALMEGRLPFDAPPPSINPITGQIINKKIRTKTAHRIARIDWCWYFFKQENSESSDNNSNTPDESPVVESSIQHTQVLSIPASNVDGTSNSSIHPNASTSPDSPIVSPASSSSFSVAATALSRKSHSVPNSPTINHYEYTYLSSIWKDAKLIVENLLVKRDLRWDTNKVLASAWCRDTLPDCLFMEGDRV